MLHDQLGSTKEDRPKSAGEGSQLAHGRFGTSLPRIATHHGLISGLLIGHSGPEPVVFCYAFGLKLLPNRHKAVGALGRAVSILSITLSLTTFALAGRALRRLGQQRDVREPVRFRWKSGREADIVRRPDLTHSGHRPDRNPAVQRSTPQPCRAIARMGSLPVPPFRTFQVIAADVISCSLLKTNAERAGDRN